MKLSPCRACRNHPVPIPRSIFIFICEMHEFRTFFFFSVAQSVARPPFHSYFCLQYNIEVGQLTVVGASFYNASHISELLPRYMLDICLSFLDIWMDGYLCSHPSSPSLCTYIKSIRGWMKACCVDGHSSFFSSAMDRTDVCASRRTPWYVFISLYFSISISFPVYCINHKNNRMGRPLKICTDLIPFYVGGSSTGLLEMLFILFFETKDFSLRTRIWNCLFLCNILVCNHQVFEVRSTLTESISRTKKFLWRQVGGNAV
jgi:hypothetical protein